MRNDSSVQVLCAKYQRLLKGITWNRVVPRFITPGVENDTRTTNFARCRRISRELGPCCNTASRTARYVKDSQLLRAASPRLKGSTSSATKYERLLR